MARGKKAEKVLTEEEKLERALVPVEEQPYAIPENWCWTKLNKVVSIVTGKKDANYADKNGIYPFFTCALEAINCNGYSFEGKSLLLPGNGANVGQVTYYEGKFEAYQRTYVLQPLNDFLNLKFVYYHILCFWEDYNKDKQYGSATNYIKMGNFINYPITIAPIDEQQRIVDRIESLFAKLDEAKEKAQSVVDGFELRKSAILHKAFTGELTRQWRKTHGIGLESRIEKTLESVCYSIFDGDHMPPPKSATGIPFLVISNVNTGHLSFDNTRFVPENYYNALSETRQPEKGDILYTLVGSYGIPVVVDSEKLFCFQRHMALLKLKDVESRYLWYMLQSKEMFRKATDIATGTAQLTIPIKKLRKLKFPWVSQPEQIEIIRILDNLLDKEQQIKELAGTVWAQIESMKKSILARAFRGELGTNDPTEESAVKLLRQIEE